MLRIYGIDIDGSVCAADIAEMTEQEKIDFLGCTSCSHKSVEL